MNCLTCEIGYRKAVTKEIKKRVKDYDNREYEIVQDICAHYDCNDSKIFHSQPTDSHVERTLYIYCMVYLLQWKQSDLVPILGMQKGNISRDLKAIMTRFKGRKISETFGFLLKY